MKTLIPYIALAGFIAFYFLEPKEVEVIDNTDYYRAENDSLETLNTARLRMIESRNKRIESLQGQNDSLKTYQNKIYVYYAKEMYAIWKRMGWRYKNSKWFCPQHAHLTLSE